MNLELGGGAKSQFQFPHTRNVLRVRVHAAGCSRIGSQGDGGFSGAAGVREHARSGGPPATESDQLGRNDPAPVHGVCWPTAGQGTNIFMEAARWKGLIRVLQFCQLGNGVAEWYRRWQASSQGPHLLEGQ